MRVAEHSEGISESSDKDASDINMLHLMKSLSGQVERLSDKMNAIVHKRKPHKHSSSTRVTDKWENWLVSGNIKHCW